MDRTQHYTSSITNQPFDVHELRQLLTQFFVATFGQGAIALKNFDYGSFAEDYKLGPDSGIKAVAAAINDKTGFDIRTKMDVRQADLCLRFIKQIIELEQNKTDTNDSGIMVDA